MLDFKNKIIVITGASSGIGEASAIMFAKKKANVILVSRKKEKLIQVKNKISKFQINSLVCPCDVSKKEEVEKMKDKILEKFGRVDVLVNNAGFAIYGSILDLTIEEIEDQMKTNYFGMVYCIKNFLPTMLKQKSGHIVNVASVAASFGLPGIASYCASKFAMLGFSEGLRHELHNSGVGVTVVSPIMVKTNFFDHPSFENMPKFFTSLSPQTVAKAVMRAAYSPRLEIIVPSVVRGAVWVKHTMPYLVNPIISSAFRKQLKKSQKSK